MHGLRERDGSYGSGGRIWTTYRSQNFHKNFGVVSIIFQNWGWPSTDHDGHENYYYEDEEEEDEEDVRKGSQVREWEKVAKELAAEDEEQRFNDDRLPATTPLPETQLRRFLTELVIHTYPALMSHPLTSKFIRTLLVTVRPATSSAAVTDFEGPPSRPRILRPSPPPSPQPPPLSFTLGCDRAPLVCLLRFEAFPFATPLFISPPPHPRLQFSPKPRLQPTTSISLLLPPPCGLRRSSRRETGSEIEKMIAHEY